MLTADERPLGYQVAGRPMLGRLTIHEFDTLELVKLLGGVVTSETFGDRVDLKRSSANARLKRLHDTGLLAQTIEREMCKGANVRVAYYNMSKAGERLFAEAWAALDASLEEAAA